MENKYFSYTKTNLVSCKRVSSVHKITFFFKLRLGKLSLKRNKQYFLFELFHNILGMKNELLFSSKSRTMQSDKLHVVSS